MRSLLPSLAEYRRAELRHAPYRVAIYAGLAGLAMIASCQLLFPRLPAQVIDFLRVAFHLRDLGGVVLFNDYVAVYFCAFSAGLFGLLGVVVGPREEQQLELLLCKPVPAADFLAARTWPVLAMTTVIGVALAAACAAASLPYLGASGSVSAAGALGAGLAMTALVLFQLTALSIVFVRAADSMNAVLVALVVALMPMLPSAAFLYRPDLFVDRPELAALTVLANLVWYDATLAWLGPALLLLALVVAALGVRVGGRLLTRSDRP
ncbi:hypothetical protein [Nannocystis sp.]|uniref:hypothetical protein n=1 Tax=Nannocystis sp. TaxID=1962667 RepID=UPI002427B99A|nr:hypothetical protein [Nannocystis sp.]MBK7825670.1 hypothetical protein [Nannocystis sp.]MBK9757126.1 hypothetical protein [Nannocystis sp.]